MHRVVSDYTQRESSDSSNIKVYVRCRPEEDDEAGKNSSSEFLTIDPDDEKRISIKDPDQSVAGRKYTEVDFQFDKIFSKDITQEEIFLTVCQPQVDHVLNGYNSCCFAYGQTGSGKTYSMFGLDGDIRGLIPRSVEYTLSKLEEKSEAYEVAMVCSFLEIYNDQIRDLGKAYLAAMGVETSNTTELNEKTSTIVEKYSAKRGNSFFADVFHTEPRNSNGNNLLSTLDMMPGLKEVVEGYQTMNHEIREDAEGNVFVQGLSMVPVTTLEEVMSIISLGLRVRATHETKMNASSSRSHTIFSITIVQRDKVSGVAISGNLNLVDLAGSERLKKSESQGPRLKEALHINSSLTCLGKVIMALDPSHKQANNIQSPHIPYRESKLTRILQNSLGGSSYTVLLAALHPKASYYDECLSTLQFANRCRSVRNNPRVNYIFDNEDKERKIKRLMDEISSLRGRINQLEFLLKEAKESRISYDKLRQIFQMLGLEIIIDKNNVIFNGQSFDITNIMADAVVPSSPTRSSSNLDIQTDNYSVSSGAKSSPRDRIASRGQSRGGSRVIQESVNEKQQKIISELTTNNSELAAKNKEKKILLEEKDRQINELTLEVIKLKSSNQHNLYESEVKLKEKEDNYQLLLAGLKSSYDRDIKEILSHNDVFMSTHYKTINNLPKTLLNYSKNIDMLNKKKHLLNDKLKSEFNDHLNEINAYHNHELNTLQSQFSCYLQQKDCIIADLVEKFNTYRFKKARYVEACEKEIVTLFGHNLQIEKILDDVESGKYHIKQVQVQGIPHSHSHSLTGQVIASNTLYSRNSKSDLRPHTTIGSSHLSLNDNSSVSQPLLNSSNTINGPGRRPSLMGAVVLPKGLRPVSMSRADFNGLYLAKRLYDKHQTTTQQIEFMKELTLKRAIAKVSKNGEFIDLGDQIEGDQVLDEQIGEFLREHRQRQTQNNSLQGRKNSLSMPRSRQGSQSMLRPNPSNQGTLSRPNSGSKTLPPLNKTGKSYI